jgi:serine/threonine protein kinase
MPSEPIRPGTRIGGRYEVLVHIATGGMGKIYKARDEVLGRVVALKVLAQELGDKPAALERFRREARHAARLSHKNVVTLYDWGEVDGVYYMALEYVQGIDLYEYIERKGRLAPEEARRILLQAGKALDHAFQHGIVHRDIKPSNFLLCSENNRLRVKLTDLGLARSAEDDEQFRVTRAGSTVGTIDYLSPEQARDSAAADIRSDIYSLGCTFYHMLAGKPPFAEGGLGERVYKHMQVDPPDVRQLNPDVSGGLWAVLRRMLAKRPEDRYQTPAGLLEDLKALADESGRPRPVRAASLRPRHDEPVPLTEERPGSSDDLTPPPEPPALDISSAEASQPTPFELPSRPPSSGSSLVEPVRDDPAVLGMTLEQVQAAAAQFDRAQEAAAKDNLDYALDLLLSCCKLDPLTTAYRQKLREVGRLLARRKGRGGWFSGLTARTRFKAARRAGDLRKVLELGEELLLRSPGDMKTHLDMATAADQLGLKRLAIWLLDQARLKDPGYLPVLRFLARIYEKLRDYQQAISTWELVKKAAPTDPEAFRKIHDLAANYTMARARYRP